MTGIIDYIEQAFTAEHVPSENDLVRRDGYDELAKEYLLKHLYGKTQSEILDELRSGALGNGSMCTEELEVAEPVGIRYYLKPFLIHLAEEMRSNPQALDNETPFFLFAHIANILKHRGTATFTSQQLRAISALVEESQKALSALPQDAIWKNDVSGKLYELKAALIND